MMRVVAEVAEGGHAGVHDEHDVPAGAAVPAIGAAAGDVRFAPEGGCPVAASTAGDMDPNLVSEHR